MFSHNTLRLLSSAQGAVAARTVPASVEPSEASIYIPSYIITHIENGIYIYGNNLCGLYRYMVYLYHNPYITHVYIYTYIHILYIHPVIISHIYITRGINEVFSDISNPGL